MSEASPTLAQAAARRADAKQRMFDTLGEAQARLNPMTIAQNAVETVASNVMAGTANTVRTRPGAVAAVVGAVTLFLARKPIGRMLRSDSDDATG